MNEKLLLLLPKLKNFGYLRSKFLPHSYFVKNLNIEPPSIIIAIYLNLLKTRYEEI